MQTDVLNQMLGSFRELKLSEFDDNQISKTTLPEGGILFLSSVNNSVLAYIKVEKLGIDSAKKQIFEELLSSNLFGGEFGNIRIAYDRDTTVVWLCYNILTENLNALSFEEQLRGFISDALNYKAILLRQVLSKLLDISESESPAASEYISNIPSTQNIYSTSQAAAAEPVKDQNSAASRAAEPEEITVDKILHQALFMMA